jgi:hypothetical protein
MHTIMTPAPVRKGLQQVPRKAANESYYMRS